ncbi:hypothetical protein FRB96_005233 [Tulasnella sp. 330]|nr:hypothetical protein FRB96_005233 [Tulasnella sp. 330]KAG8868129.1 hypothetical protein FRB97_002676 [Tulasnella sp. 331]KAG8890156.1 hypothetical protein FRB98_000884 [Tulasnella sp. 332]
MSRSLSFYPDPTLDPNGFARLLSHKLDALNVDAPRYNRNTPRFNTLRQMLLGDQSEQRTSWRSPHSAHTQGCAPPIDNILDDGKELFFRWKRECADMLVDKEGEANVREATTSIKEKLLERVKQDSTLGVVLTLGQAYRPPRQDPVQVQDQPQTPAPTQAWSTNESYQNRWLGAMKTGRRDVRAPCLAMQHPMERTTGRRRVGMDRTRIVGHGGEGFVSSLLLSGLGPRGVPVA